MTKTQITWNPPAWNKPGEAAAAQRTPDLSAIVREIVSQPGWKADQPMVFIVGGDGRRVAVSSRGGNKDSTRLVIDAELPDRAQSDDQPLQPYDVDLIFAAPRGETRERVFDIMLGQTVVATDFTVTPDAAQARVLRLDGVGIGNSLTLTFVPKRGQPLLSGLRLRKAAK